MNHKINRQVLEQSDTKIKQLDFNPKPMQEGEPQQLNNICWLTSDN